MLFDVGNLLISVGVCLAAISILHNVELFVCEFLKLKLGATEGIPMLVAEVLLILSIPKKVHKGSSIGLRLGEVLVMVEQLHLFSIVFKIITN